MANPHNYLKSISFQEFFTNIEARKNEYYEYHDSCVSPFIEANKLYEIGFAYGEFRKLEKAKNYWELCYLTREYGFLTQIKNVTTSLCDKEKIKVFVEINISEIKQILKSLETMDLDQSLEIYKDNIHKKLCQLIKTIEATYLDLPPLSNNIKIKWKGKTNLLTTLFYDLLNGQEKGKTITSPLIEAQKKDIEQLLINNFLDSKGKPLTISTISDYLNTSKPKTRLPKGYRIEFPEK